MISLDFNFLLSPSLPCPFWLQTFPLGNAAKTERQTYPVPIDLTDESDTILLPVDESSLAPQPSLGSNRADTSIREEATPQRLSQTAYTSTNTTARVSLQDSAQSSKHTDFPTPSYSHASGAHAVSAASASPTKQAPTTGSSTATVLHPLAAAQSQTGWPTIVHPMTAIPAGGQPLAASSSASTSVTEGRRESSQVEHKNPSSPAAAQVKKEPTNANANSPVLSAPAKYISHGLPQTSSPYGSSDKSAIFHAPPRPVVSNTAMQQVAPQASNSPIYNVSPVAVLSTPCLLGFSKRETFLPLCILSLSCSPVTLLAIPSQLPMAYRYSFPGSAHPVRNILVLL